MKIGILPYYYFLLLKPQRHHDVGDWTTAVLLLPFTTTTEVACNTRLEDCCIYTSFYLGTHGGTWIGIGRLPYYYFLLLILEGHDGLGDWKTAVLLLPFYFVRKLADVTKIGRLPYYYFLFTRVSPHHVDWKTAVLLLPSTFPAWHFRNCWLEDCRILYFLLLEVSENLR